MKITGFLALTAGLALAAIACLTALPAPPLVALGVAMLALFAPAHFRLAFRHPRSIFETRRAGLA